MVVGGHQGLVNGVCFTPDNQLVLTASEDKTVGIWDVNTGKCSEWLKGHTKAVRTVAVTEDGSKAISAGTDGTMRVWDITTGKCVQTLGRHMDHTWTLKCLPDGQVVTGSMDKLVRLWDLSCPDAVRVIGKHLAGVRSLGVMPDGRRIVVGTMENEESNAISVFDLGKPTKPESSWAGHDSTITCLVPLPDGRVISGGFDFTVRVWGRDANVAEEVNDTEGAVPWTAAAFRDGRGYVVGFEAGDLRVWDLKHKLEALNIPMRHPWGVFGVDISSDSRMIASSGADRVVRLLRVED